MRGGKKSSGKTPKGPQKSVEPEVGTPSASGAPKTTGEKSGNKRPASSPADTLGKDTTKARDSKTTPQSSREGGVAQETLPDPPPIPETEEPSVLNTDPDDEDLIDLTALGEGLEDLAPPKKSAKTTYAKKAAGPLFPHLLSVHLGSNERKFLPEKLFQEYLVQLEAEVYRDIMGSNEARLRCAFKRWSNGRGLLGCRDAPTAEWLAEATTRINIGGQSFKAWARGDFGNLSRMSFYIQKDCGVPKEDILTALVRQNRIPGTHVVHFVSEVKTPKKKGDKTSDFQLGYRFVAAVDEEFRKHVMDLDKELYLSLRCIKVNFPPRKSPEAEKGEGTGPQPHPSDPEPFRPTVAQFWAMPRLKRVKVKARMRKRGQAPFPDQPPAGTWVNPKGARGPKKPKVPAGQGMTKTSENVLRPAKGFASGSKTPDRNPMEETQSEDFSGTTASAGPPENMDTGGACSEGQKLPV